MNRPSPRRSLALTALALLMLGRCSCPASLGPCQSSADCIEGEVCVEDSCRTACNVDGDCTLAENCDQGACLPNLRDSGGGGVDSATTDVIGGDLQDRDVSLPDVSAADSAASDLAAPDTAAPDAAVSDLAAPDTAAPDAAAPDMAAPDTATPDAAAPDMAAPDTAAPDMAAPDMAAPDMAAPDLQLPDTNLPDLNLPDTTRPSCDLLYGAALEYELCDELSESCTFGVRTNGNCEELCTAFGGVCLGAFDDVGGGVGCEIADPVDCLTAFTTQICHCSR